MRFIPDDFEYKGLIGPAIVFALFVLLYYPILEWMGNAWLYADEYSHGFILLPVALFIVWTRRKDLNEKDSKQYGIWIFVAGLITYIVGFIRLDNFLSGLSLFLTLPGLVLFFRGIRALKALAFPIFLIIFMIPFPWLDRVGLNLQTISARSSAWIVDLMGVDVTRTGNNIEVGDAAFSVDMACSGMHSLIALLALAAIFAYVLNGTLAKKTILFVMAIPVAILSNLIRLVIIILIGNKWGEDAAMNYFHDWASPVLFLVAIVLMVIIAKIIGFNFRETPEY
jgi:exosortase